MAKSKLPLKSLQSELTLAMANIDSIRRKYKYAAIPTLLLRHEDGASKSIVISNDSLGKVVLCIAELGDTGEESSQSVHEATLKLFMGGDGDES